MINHAAENNIKAEDLEIDDNFETLIISIIFWIKTQTSISENQMKEFAMK